jgi:Leucine-rich repeat (LRR) protein
MHPSKFQNNIRLRHLVLSEKLTLIHPETFSHNRGLDWLDLERNNITDIQYPAVRNISALQHFDGSHNSINSVHSDTFQHKVELQLLDLQCNRITDIDLSTFRYQPKLISL